MSSTQNLAPIMPFIEPIEPIELPSVFQSEDSHLNQTESNQTNLFNINHDPHQNTVKGDPIVNNASDLHKPPTNANDKSTKTPSEEEALLEKTRMELEKKIGELNQLKTQLAQTEERERELASKIET